MKLKIALSLVVLLTFIVAVNIYAYHASAWCIGYSWIGLKWAGASVDSPESDAGAFGSNTIHAYVSDLGSYFYSATANAYVGGYDSGGSYRSDSDSTTL